MKEEQKFKEWRKQNKNTVLPRVMLTLTCWKALTPRHWRLEVFILVA